MKGLLFSGQGAQTVGMGMSLYNEFSLARDLYHQADRVLGYGLSQISFKGPAETLTETRLCQPALFVHGFTVFSLLREQNRLENVRSAMGLSLGEVTAMTVAGVFDFETGLRVVAERARLMQEACEKTSGTMAGVIGVAREDVEALCRDFDVDVANLNCPGQIVISGEKDKVNAAVEAGRERGFKRVIPLKVAGAYHSRLMRPAAEAFSGFLGTVAFSVPEMTVYSNTTGREVKSPDEMRQALIQQVASPVLWEDCIRTAAAAGITEFYECGPGAVLAGMVRRTEPSLNVTSFSEAGDFREQA